jgi:hypothetical protein
MPCHSPLRGSSRHSFTKGELTLPNFPRTLTSVTTMPDLRANEREFASKVYQWMDSAFARGGHVRKRNF